MMPDIPLSIISSFCPICKGGCGIFLKKDQEIMKSLLLG